MRVLRLLPINFNMTKGLLKSFSIYVGSTVINSIIPFLLLPIFTKYLTPKDYGYISLFTAVNSFLAPLVGLSVVGSFSREYFSLESESFNKLLSNAFLIYLFSIPFVSFLLLLLVSILNFGDVPVVLLVYSLIFSINNFLLTSLLSILQVKSESTKYGIIQIANTLLGAALSLVLVVGFSKGWEGRILAQVIIAACFALVSFFVLRNMFSFSLQIDKIYINRILKFSLPLIPHSLGAVMITLTDRFMITKLIGVEDLGLYSIGFAIGSIIGFLEYAFNLAFTPWLFDKLSDTKNVNKIGIVNLTYFYFVAILFFVMGLIFIAPFIFSFLDDRFSKGLVYVPWIALSFAFSGMYKMVGNYIFYVKRTGILAIITLCSGILNIVLNFILIGVYGAIGAAISASLVSFIFFIITWIYSYRVYSMPWFYFMNRKNHGKQIS